MNNNYIIFVALFFAFVTLAFSLVRLYFSLPFKTKAQKSLEVRKKIIDYELVDVNAFIKDIEQKKWDKNKRLSAYETIAHWIAKRNNMKLRPAHLFPSLSREDYLLSIIRVYGPKGIIEEQHKNL